MSLLDKIKEYGKQFESEGLCIQGDTIAVRKSEELMLITKTDADFSKLTDKDICEVNFRNTDSDFAFILDKYPTVNVVLHLRSKFTTALSCAKKEIPPVLDDMAQIVGVKAKLIKNERSKILKALKKNSSVLIENNGALITGKSLNECHAAIRVLEKTAFVYAAGEILGGTKKLSLFDSALMHAIYKKKYSVKNQEAKIKEERDD